MFNSVSSKEPTRPDNVKRPREVTDETDRSRSTVSTNVPNAAEKKTLLLKMPYQQNIGAMGSRSGSMMSSQSASTSSPASPSAFMLNPARENASLLRRINSSDLEVKSRSSQSTSPGTASVASQSSTFADRIFPRVLDALKLPHCVPVPEAEGGDKERALPEINDELRASLAKQICSLIAAHGNNAGVRARYLIAALEGSNNTDLRRRILLSGCRPKDSAAEDTSAGTSSAQKDTDNELSVLSPSDFVALPETSLELMPKEERQKTLDLKERMNRNRNIQAIQEAHAIVSTLYRCPKCRKKRCAMYQQFRRGDEPMKIVLTCLECNTVFKR